MKPTDILTALDHAALMNDRWLFLAAFVLLLALCGLVIRWLVRHLNAVLREHKAEVNAHHAAMEKIIQTQNDTALRLAVCLDRNTAALSDCSFELRRMQVAA